MSELSDDLIFVKSETIIKSKNICFEIKTTEDGQKIAFIEKEDDLELICPLEFVSFNKKTKEIEIKLPKELSDDLKMLLNI